jgi:hypothetical protein
VAGNDISGTYAAAGQLTAHGQRTGAAHLVDAGNQAFVTAMHWAAFASVVTALLGVAVVLAWLPVRAAAQPAPTPTEAPEELLELAEA